MERYIVGLRCFLNKGMNKWNIDEEEPLVSAALCQVYTDARKNTARCQSADLIQNYREL